MLHYSTIELLLAACDKIRTINEVFLPFCFHAFCHFGLPSVFYFLLKAFSLHLLFVLFEFFSEILFITKHIGH